MYPGFTNKKVEKVSKAVANHVQPKLKTGSPGDIYEQEADAVAKTVLNMPGTGKENHFENGIEATKSNQLQQPEKYVQQKPAGNKNNHLSIKQSELDLSKYSAQPISSTFQKKIEPRFGYDFSGIKIHTGEKAIQMSRSLNAHAFTYGNHIFFNKGKYNPETGAGQQLLAHELTHTIQQRSVPEKSASSLTVSRTSSTMVQGGFWGNVWSGIKRGAGIIGSGILGNIKHNWNVLKSAGALLWSLQTKSSTLVWRILKHAGSGILGILEWMWTGIKAGLSHLWQGATKYFSWLNQGIFGFFSWVWSGVQAGASWANQILHGNFSGFWSGIRNAFKWLGNGALALLYWEWDGLRILLKWAKEGAIGIAKWLGKGLLAGAAWAGRLFAKLLDLARFGEIMDLIFNIFKMNTRTLNATEKNEAQKVFKNLISYWQVRIDEFSLIALIGSVIYGGKPMGVTLFHTINFNRKISASQGSKDMAWLIHEMAHIAQYESVGSQYIGESVYTQATVGYSNMSALGKKLAGKNLKDFNREDQADIMEMYYLEVANGGSSIYKTDLVRLRQQFLNREF